MKRRTRKALRAMTLTAMCGGVAVATTGFVEASAPYEAFGTGNLEKGRMDVPLYRGVAVPYELTVVRTLKPHGEMLVSLEWDKETNDVKVHLQGDGTLEYRPSVRREEGVTYFPNPVWPEQKDYDNARYQFWFLSGAPNITMYYDPVTLDFLGSEYDFDEPPPAIPVSVPSVAAVPSPFFEPEPNGDVDVTWHVPYDRLARQDNPDEWGHHYFTIYAPNLCFLNPFRIDLSTFRPYLTRPLPPEDALPFSDYVKNGIFFDITVEPRELPVVPPLTTMVASYSGSTNLGGAVPKGFEMNLDAIFASVAPATRPWPGRDLDSDWTKPSHIRGINFCEQMGQDQVMEMVDMHNEMMATGGGQ